MPIKASRSSFTFWISVVVLSSSISMAALPIYGQIKNNDEFTKKIAKLLSEKSENDIFVNDDAANFDFAISIILPSDLSLRVSLPLISDFLDFPCRELFAMLTRESKIKQLYAHFEFDVNCIVVLFY